MSAANWFIAAGLFAVAAAGGGMAYRHPDAVPMPSLSCPAPVVNVPAQAAPVVNVAAPAPVQVPAPAPARVAPAREEPAVAHRVVKKKPTARKRLQTRWGL